MAKVIFDYNNQKIEIQCKISDSLSKICKIGSTKNFQRTGKFIWYNQKGNECLGL